MKNYVSLTEQWKINEIFHSSEFLKEMGKKFREIIFKTNNDLQMIRQIHEIFFKCDC